MPATMTSLEKTAIETLKRTIVRNESLFCEFKGRMYIPLPPQADSYVTSDYPRIVMRHNYRQEMTIQWIEPSGPVFGWVIGLGKKGELAHA
jgi:hypothetical protein